MAGLADLGSHRGCRRSALGTALLAALSASSDVMCQTADSPVGDVECQTDGYSFGDVGCQASDTSDPRDYTDFGNSQGPCGPVLHEGAGWPRSFMDLRHHCSGVLEPLPLTESDAGGRTNSVDDGFVGFYEVTTPNKAGIAIRSLPDAHSAHTDSVLLPGELFAVDAVIPCDDGQEYYELSDGRGYVFKISVRDGRELCAFACTGPRPTVKKKKNDDGLLEPVCRTTEPTQVVDSDNGDDDEDDVLLARMYHAAYATTQALYQGQDLSDITVDAAHIWVSAHLMRPECFIPCNAIHDALCELRAGSSD